MLRDSRIVHIIDLLGELRELLFVIDQAGDTAPAILLKLAKEKAEEITRLTRELRQPEFWDGILRYDPFTSVKTTTHEDAIPSMENPLEKVGEPVSSHITDENIIPTEKQSEESGEELDTDNNIADTEDYSESPIIENNEPTHKNEMGKNYRLYKTKTMTSTKTPTNLTKIWKKTMRSPIYMRRKIRKKSSKKRNLQLP
jgi:hypothetical protein